jgi:2-polyprenyl-3-methyl-5-hydroxy-6-metoxy-1,4-benzoquinol methylase
MTPQELNQSKVEEFGEKMVSVMNSAATALMTSIGHQTGLFDTMADLPPSTSKQIATAAKLNERYVREWLGAMVTGRVVEYHPIDGTYALPPEHAAWLTRAAGSNNLARETQCVAMLGEVEQGIVESFRTGGGMLYSAFPRFQQLMAEGSRANAHATLFDTTLPLVPGMVERLQVGIDIADIGCGQGHAINLMAQAFPQSRFIGYEFSEEAIAVGRADAKQMGLSNAHFEVKDVATLAMSGQFDFITAFDAIHDQAQPATVLQRIANALRADGTFLMVDIAASSKLEENLDHMLGPWIYTISCMHCMTVSLALDGAGLGAMWGEQKALQMLADAGFTHVEVKRNESDLFNNYYIATKN